MIDTTHTDILALRPSLRATMVGVYREMACVSRTLHAESRSPRHLAEAQYAESRAAALELGAPSLAELFPCSD